MHISMLVPSLRGGGGGGGGGGGVGGGGVGNKWAFSLSKMTSTIHAALRAAFGELWALIEALRVEKAQGVDEISY